MKCVVSPVAGKQEVFCSCVSIVRAADSKLLVKTITFILR